MRVFVFCAHEDDECCMGGTIVKHTRRGDEVTVIYTTDGSGGIISISDREEVRKIREEEAKASCKVLGVHKVEFLRYRDGFLYMNEDTVRRVGEIIRSGKPDRVYAPFGENYNYWENTDHPTTYRIVEEAIFKSYYAHYPIIGSDVWTVKDFWEYEIWTLPFPTAYVDVTDVWSTKMESLKQHKSQIGAGAWGRTQQGVESRARLRGSHFGCDYAEAFKAVLTPVFP